MESMKKFIVLVVLFYISFWSIKAIGLFTSFIYPDRQLWAAYQNQNRKEINKWIAVSNFTHSVGYIVAWNLIGILGGINTVYFVSKKWKK